ncbi:MAG: type II secretion system protein, partial [Planctomycetota bacterium]
MEPCMSFFGRRVSNRAFTIVELLTVMAVIAILSAILLPVLGGVIRSGEQAESLNRMRQIGQWMQLYAQDSNDVVLPSRFDYRGQRFAGKAASLPNSRFTQFDVEPSAGRGTWADILWVRNCQAEADYVTSRHDPVDPSDPQLFRVRARFHG